MLGSEEGDKSSRKSGLNSSLASTLNWQGGSHNCLAAMAWFLSRKVATRQRGNSTVAPAMHQPLGTTDRTSPRAWLVAYAGEVWTTDHLARVVNRGREEAQTNARRGTGSPINQSTHPSFPFEPAALHHIKLQLSCRASNSTVSRRTDRSPTRKTLFSSVLVRPFTVANLDRSDLRRPGVSFPNR